MTERRDVIGSYLDAVQKSRGTSARQESEPTVSATQDERMRLLSILAKLTEAGQDLPVQELQTISEIGFAEFGSAMAALDKAGLIELAGEPGKETCRLTDSGRVLVTYPAA
jgi:hypothetical protein